MSKVKPAPLPPDTVIGGYRIVRKLAAGGFGIVYLAVDTEGLQVAIKEYLPSSLAARAPGELLPQVQPEKLSLYRLGLKSFFEEGRALAQISHQSVVSVLNFFRENETVYMVMNYLEGASLQEFIITARELKKQKVFRESTIRSLYDEVLRGLRIVHQHKMLHLDIKPANIFITNDNKAVMLDFGAARQVIADLETKDPAMAAELGTMRVTEQIDALETLAISPTDPNRLYAIAESKKTQLYMTSDGGQNWVKKSGSMNVS